MLKILFDEQKIRKIAAGDSVNIHALILATAFLLLPFCAGAADMPLVTLGGEIGAADKASRTRFGSAPYDSLPWIRADLTGEKASDSDDAGWGHILFRPFKNYSGDISGRFIEIMAMNSRGGYNVHPAFRELLAELPKYQRPGGYFAASGLIDWQKSIDNKDIYKSTMMPALWGNARLLCGLVEASRAFPDDASLPAVARRLGDFYVGLIPRFSDPARMGEYTGSDTYASGYVTCYFPAMEGLVKLHGLTGEKKYLDTAITMAAFYKTFDKLPIDHAHGMLCNQVSLLLLYEATKDVSYLERVEKRWDDLVKGGYINPAGGILEKCRVKFARDEGCAIADWLRLNLALGRVTGKARYWAMAERTLHNHFLQNQTPKGGFGHRGTLCDDKGVLGFKGSIHEAVWCCTFHGQLGFINLRDNLVIQSDKGLSVLFALDFVMTNSAGKIVSEIQPAAGAGEVMRQRISLAGMPARVVQVRKPHWADNVKAVDPEGKDFPLTGKDEFLTTTQAVTEAVFVYMGDVYAENRRCVRLMSSPAAGESFVLGHGPKILATVGKKATMPAWPEVLAQLGKQGVVPFSAAMRTNECSFVYTAGGEPLPKGPALPVKKAKFHCYEKLRAGRIKTGQGWNAVDFAMSIYNPSLTNTIKVTWTLVADDPGFVYKNGQKGMWTKDFELGPDRGWNDNVYSGMYPDQKWPVPEDSNWTGKSEFSSDMPFYAYILKIKEAEGQDSTNAVKKSWLMWGDEVPGLWDEDLKQTVFPYSNYWHNDPYWLGGWHTRFILVNRLEVPVIFKVSHKPDYWIRYSAVNKWTRVPYKEQFIEFKLAPGDKQDVWLEDIFGWDKDLPQATEGRLLVTTVPDSAREKCEMKLYVLPNKVSVESLKEEEKKALSEDAGFVVSDGQR